MSRRLPDVAVVASWLGTTSECMTTFLDVFRNAFEVPCNEGVPQGVPAPTWDQGRPMVRSLSLFDHGLGMVLVQEFPEAPEVDKFIRGAVSQATLHLSDVEAMREFGFGWATTLWHGGCGLVFVTVAHGRFVLRCCPPITSPAPWPSDDKWWFVCQTQSQWSPPLQQQVTEDPERGGLALCCTLAWPPVAEQERPLMEFIRRSVKDGTAMLDKYGNWLGLKADWPSE